MSGAWPRRSETGAALVIGSIGVSAPATRMSKGRDVQLAQHVCETAEHINALLGV